MKNGIVVVDIGGSGARLGRVNNGIVEDITRVKIGNTDELAASILQYNHNRRPDAIGVSVAGFVNAGRGYVRLSRAAPWAEGFFAQDIRNKTRVENVIVVNDGEAHALAMLSDRRVKYGAMCLSIGTAVGFGVINENGNVIRTLSGENWDLGEMHLKTRASDPHVWRCLGSEGLSDLTNSMGDAGYSHFGYRLGYFLSQLSVIFMPRTIALTGGVIHSPHWKDMQESLQCEFRQDIPSYLERPDVIVLGEAETALSGLANCFSMEKWKNGSYQGGMANVKYVE